MKKLTIGELTTAIDVFNHPQSGDKSDFFGAHVTSIVAMKELKHYKELEEQLLKATGKDIDGVIKTLVEEQFIEPLEGEE